jgi:hypothetical protein
MQELRERRKQKLRFLVCPGKNTGSMNLQMPFSDAEFHEFDHSDFTKV